MRSCLWQPPSLEIGCGEGNNLARLLRGTGMTAIDRFHRKLLFAASQHPGARFATADAHALPFADASFQTVFIRDMLHHVEDPRVVLGEAVRVLVPIPTTETITATRHLPDSASRP